MEHVAQGDLVSLRAFEDNSADTNSIDCGLISKAYSAINEGVVLEVISAGCNVVCRIAIHHPTGSGIGSVQGSSKVIIDLLNGGSRYKYMRISCLAAGTPLLLLFVAGIILLLLSAVRLYVKVDPKLPVGTAAVATDGEVEDICEMVSVAKEQSATVAS